MDLADPGSRVDRPHKSPADAGSRSGAVAPVAGTAGLLTIAEAAGVLGVPTTWLRDKVTERRVPHTRLGRHVRFTAAHLAQIVAAGEQQARAPHPTGTGARRRRAG